MRYLHITSALNRESINEHGLDWTRMGYARGIAGSTQPKQAGCFVCRDEWEANWFLRNFNNGDGPFDVWEVIGVAEDELIDSSENFTYVPRSIPRSNLRLVCTDVSPGGSLATGGAP